MSFNVLVIPEDFTKDQGILKPIVSAMLERAGKSQAKVRVCQNPRLGGLGQALDKVEVWVLAGLELPSDWQWQSVRAEPNPKERYYLPFAEQQGLAQTPDQGRKILATRAVKRFQRICTKCPDDVLALAERIQAL